MPEVIFTGPAGRLEGRFHPSKQRGAPIAVILHPHPQFGGTMNNQIVYNLYYAFAERGFSVLRFNFRGVGRSQGAFDHGQGELSDAAAALDWVQSINPEARACWIAGVSFGSWIGMQLLMRRPEIEGFISIAPPANRFDFSFLAPCPSSGLFVHGDQDRVAPLKEVMGLIEKLKTQRGILIEHAVVEGANHFFEDRVEPLIEEVGKYLDRRLDNPPRLPTPARAKKFLSPWEEREPFPERPKPAPPFSHREKVPAARADEGIGSLTIEARPPPQSASADSSSPWEEREPLPEKPKPAPPFSQREKVPAARADEGIGTLAMEARPPPRSASADSSSPWEEREPILQRAPLRDQHRSAGRLAALKCLMGFRHIFQLPAAMDRDLHSAILHHLEEILRHGV